MAELGKAVPILPIVTKSDSMTIREAATYRREVYRKLQNPQLPESQGPESFMCLVLTVPSFFAACCC